MDRILFSNTIPKVKRTMKVGKQLCGSQGLVTHTREKALVVRVKETLCAYVLGALGGEIWGNRDGKEDYCAEVCSTLPAPASD